jgi:hypothetical protein
MSGVGQKATYALQQSALFDHLVGLAICIAQALSQDHFFERSMLWAAS